MIGTINGYDSTLSPGMYASNTQKQANQVFTNADRVFAKVDVNKDDMINKEEFQKFADTIQKTTGMTIDVNKTFAAADTNGDNQLTRNEMEQFLPTESAAATWNGTAAGVSTLNSGAGKNTVDASELKSAVFQIKLDAYKSLFNQSISSSGNHLNLFG